MKATYKISPLGDTALIIDFGNSIELRLHNKVMAACSALEAADLAGIRDIVPAYSSVTIHYEVTEVKKTSTSTPAFNTLKEEIEIILRAAPGHSSISGKKARIPVCYAPQYGWDIQELALQAKMSVNQVIELHTHTVYRVYLVGFLPGFAYLGDVDERIAFPRKPEPRSRIEAGSVGIAGRQTGIYPLTSPGGWQIIGRTPERMFDKNKADPALLAAGDEVEFFSITEDEFKSY